MGLRVVPVCFMMFAAGWGQRAALGGERPAPAASASRDQPASARLTATAIGEMQRKLEDWGQLGYYKAANAELTGTAADVPTGSAGSSTQVAGRVVFFGASMTENWGKNGSVFFPGKGYINRGIGGQTTAQMVVRFRQDVIDLHPQVVVILGGTNDVAGNTGPMTPQMTEGNWASMAELARANGVQPIFASITPASEIPWRRGIHPAEKIRTLNTWLKAYCSGHELIYLDYYGVLTDADGGMQADLTVDGVHASVKGYTLMMPLAQAAIDGAMAHPLPRNER